MNSAALTDQLTKLTLIPARVLANYPAWLGFAGVNIVLNMAVNAVPSIGGPVGMIANAALGGMAQVTQFVAWETLKTA